MKCVWVGVCGGGRSGGGGGGGGTDRYHGNESHGHLTLKGQET